MPFPRGGSGGVASLTGAGILSATGILNQSGGMNIEDSEADGFTVDTNNTITLLSTAGGVAIQANGTGGITIKNLGGGAYGTAIYDDGSVGITIGIVTGGSGAVTLTGGGGLGPVGIGVESDKLSFLGATAIAQKARIGAITYGGTGTSTGKALPSITAASVDTSAASLVTVQNLAASLQAVLALFDTALSAAAGGFGLTA